MADALPKSKSVIQRAPVASPAVFRTRAHYAYHRGRAFDPTEARNTESFGF